MAKTDAQAFDESNTVPEQLLKVSPEFGSLGATTSSKGWIALAGLSLVLVSASIWGYFGTLTVQKTFSAVSVSNGVTYEIVTPTTGTIQQLSPVEQIYNTGDVIAVIDPVDGGPSVNITAQGTLLVMGWEFVIGSPVIENTVLGRGVLVGTSKASAGYPSNNEIVAVSFLPLSDLETLEQSVALKIEMLDYGLNKQTYPAKLDSFGRYPLSERRIAQIIGSETKAAEIMDQTGGEPHLVSFGFLSKDDEAAVVETTSSKEKNRFTSGQDAEVIVTLVSNSPLKVLFGSGS